MCSPKSVSCRLAADALGIRQMGSWGVGEMGSWARGSADGFVGLWPHELWHHGLRQRADGQPGSWGDGLVDHGFMGLWALGHGLMGRWAAGLLSSWGAGLLADGLLGDRFMGSWVHRLMGSRALGSHASWLRSSWAHELMGSWALSLCGCGGAPNDTANGGAKRRCQRQREHKGSPAVRRALRTRQSGCRARASSAACPAHTPSARPRPRRAT